MQVHVRDGRTVRQVVGYIERMGFHARRTGRNTIEVTPRSDVPDNEARIELDLFLTLWRALDENRDVTLVAVDPGATQGEAPTAS